MELPEPCGSHYRFTITTKNWCRIIGTIGCTIKITMKIDRSTLHREYQQNRGVLQWIYQEHVEYAETRGLSANGLLKLSETSSPPIDLPIGISGHCKPPYFDRYHDHLNH